MENYGLNTEAHKLWRKLWGIFQQKTEKIVFNLVSNNFMDIIISKTLQKCTITTYRFEGRVFVTESLLCLYPGKVD